MFIIASIFTDESCIGKCNTLDEAKIKAKKFYDGLKENKKKGCVFYITPEIGNISNTVFFSSKDWTE